MCVVIYNDWYQLLPVRPIPSELPREMGSHATSGRAGKAQSHVRREHNIWKGPIDGKVAPGKDLALGHQDVKIV